MMVARRTPGPAYANLQGRKPREVWRGGASDAMGIWVLADVLPVSAVERCSGKPVDGATSCWIEPVAIGRIDVAQQLIGRFVTAGRVSRGRACSWPVERQRSRRARICGDCDCGHEVSILITTVGAVGRYRGVAAALEGLDDDHAAAAARARVREWLGLVGLGTVGSSASGCWHVEQLARAGDVVGAACRWRAGRSGGCGGSRCGRTWMQEAADELVGGERHDLVAIAAFDAVVLPA